VLVAIELVAEMLSLTDDEADAFGADVERLPLFGGGSMTDDG
jgi:hypothetical protein